MEKYLAHIRDDKTEQTLQEHSAGTAMYSSKALKECGLSATGELAGMLHDMGKAREAFTNYITDASNGIPVRRGSVNHTFAGCKYLLNNFHNAEPESLADLAAEIAAYSCAAHHGQVDCINKEKESGFEHRRKSQKIEYETVSKNFMQNGYSSETIKTIFQNSAAEMDAIATKLVGMRKEDEGELDFYLGLLTRLVLSAVVNGDRRDTEEFCSNKKCVEFAEDRKKLWTDCLEYIENKLSEFSNETPIQNARKEISDTCAKAAEKESRVLRLNVPTGGGKTLSSLRFAIKYAAEHNKSRVIFTSSLLTILEQNAAVLKDFIENKSIILEHHSNVVRPKESDELTAWTQMSEQWSAPVIITTMVQLLNTLFDGRIDCVRRFHALVNSVIVVDEIQTLPANMLTLFNLALNFLTEICGTTVVLCSATQPCLEKTEHALIREPEDIVPYSEEIVNIFKRTELKNAGRFLLTEIPTFAEKVLNDADSVLVVCNTKSEARRIYNELKNKDYLSFHLSASMCVKHRQNILETLRTALVDKNRKKKVVCVSTQIIEAGVDISFQNVIRLAAGMDSIIQSAGRCNRNGEQPEPAPVYIVDCTDENLSKLKEIERGKRVTLQIIDAFDKKPEKFRNDLSSAETIELYYKTLYKGYRKGYMDFAVDGTSLYDLLGSNTKYAAESCRYAGKYYLQQAFKTAGELFKVFDDNTWDVIVPYGEGADIREELIELNREYEKDYDRISALIQRAKLFTISVYEYQKKKLEERGAWLELFDGRVTVLTDGFYSEETGLDLEDKFLEV